MRFWAARAVALLITVGLAAVIWFLIYLLALNQEWLLEPPLSNKFYEFDFANYSFGLVAMTLVAVGVYLSWDVRSVSDEMMRVLELNYVPDPFGERKEIEDRCGPTPLNSQRPRIMKVIYAVTQLVKWERLNASDRQRFLGDEGLDAEQVGLAKPFLGLQERYDRRFVILGASAIVLIYLTIPVLYIVTTTRVVGVTLTTLCIGSIVEISLCTLLYYRRRKFMMTFEKHLDRSREDIKIYLVRRIESDAVQATEVAARGG